jgi:predicted nucleic acid-binding protein
MNVLVDTSVWVNHFRAANPTLIGLLESDRVLGHPLVLAEIACGTPPSPRAQTLESLSLLRPAQQASLPEVMAFIEREKLYGLGCGVVDLTLLASACMTSQSALWTLDRRLSELANRYGVEFELSLH